ncbi:MAG TPA: carboxypeptidase regulatory-like domain-containing protein, partial [Vicinamibacteria bacterium]|nr:carboxypeptidase regulatory-like domain-containing protein [Vicinamibacteria bacterium]
MNRHSLRACVAVLAALFALVASAQTPSAPGPVTPPKAPASAPTRKSPKTPPPLITSLDVAVTDPAGKPLEGAFVMALPTQGAYRPYGGIAPEKVRSTLTGREGKAKLESLPPGPWSLTVHARGLVTKSLRRVTSGPVSVRLKEGGSITGVAREGRGSRPLPDVRVSVARSVPVTGGWEDEATRNEATTDAKGRFRIDGI